MFAVIFEVQPKPERFQEYLEIAGRLRPALERIDGFISNERFTSRRMPGLILSVSIWRDEKALIRWRTLGGHHAAQQAGRDAILADYRLRVGEITADTQLPEGEMLAQQRLDATETGTAKVATLTEPVDAEQVPAFDERALEQELFEGINQPSKLLMLASWRDAVPVPRQANVRHRQIRIIRDYGMRDRREAPQYYPPVQSQGDAD